MVTALDDVSSGRADDPTAPTELRVGREFGTWLRTELRCRRMSQRQLAGRSGVDHSTVCRILDGHVPSLRTAVLLARSLGAGELPLGSPVPGEASPACRVERALRADPALCDAAVARTMAFYLNERARSHHARSPVLAGPVGIWPGPNSP